MTQNFSKTSIVKQFDLYMYLRLDKIKNTRENPLLIEMVGWENLKIWWNIMINRSMQSIIKTQFQAKGISDEVLRGSGEIQIFCATHWKLVGNSKIRSLKKSSCNHLNNQDIYVMCITEWTIERFEDTSFAIKVKITFHIQRKWTSQETQIYNLNISRNFMTAASKHSLNNIRRRCSQSNMII